MPTVEQHLTAIYETLDRIDDSLKAAWEAIYALQAGDPLQQEIDLDLPQASAGSTELRGSVGGQATVETHAEEDGSLTVVLPAASPEKKEQRRKFAEMIQLETEFGELEGMTASEAYSKGGPRWLYLGSKEGRDFIISLPESWRRAMYEDILEENPQEAHEFARDVLKDTSSDGGREVTYDYLLEHSSVMGG